MRAFQLWTELHQRLRLGKTIDVENQNSNLTLKPLSQTRWESRNNAITPFRFQIGEIYDALYDASNDIKIDVFGKNTATNLAKKIKTFKFILLLGTRYCTELI
jgi:hypothetical protein